MTALDNIAGFLIPYGAVACGISVVVILAIGFLGAPYVLWGIAIATLLIGYAAPEWLLITYILISLLFIIKPLRTLLVSKVVMFAMNKLKFVPVISETEKTALEAGVVWIEADLFSGKPNFKKMLEVPYPKLSAEEQAFMDGPVDKICQMADDWKITQERALPKEIWDALKGDKFFGMIIPKEYGGLGFSAYLHSCVIKTLSSRCVPLSTTVMVPNSLGPAELLIHYGTQAQKDKYLPRLATGEEIPCFALTEPTAGSDAGSITASGELFKGDDGKIYIRLNWNKRYITLAAISTVLGLAFKLRDPKNLLGKGEELGITCALIPTKTPGVVVGKRHDPLTIPFYNCPTQGKDVVVPLDAIIGEESGVGRGWKMLMECLAAGRGISLPGQATGGVGQAALGASAHSTIRKQFGLSIGKFEGIEEPLARITGFSYILEAQRRLTCSGLDLGVKPPVVTAICKYNATEMSRIAINDAMDILGGNAISRGPRNFIANGYMGMPISITVEGANILTRTLIIFGQGAIRAHPYAYKELNALEKNDAKAFDAAFWGHVGHVVRNLFRAVLLSVTRGRLSMSPVSGAHAKYFRKMSWASAVFALMADVALGGLGGSLKTRGKLTGRYADFLSWMYFGFAVLYRFEKDGKPKEDIPLLDYSMQHAFTQMQRAMDGIYENLDIPVLKWILAGPIRFWSGLNIYGATISDKNTHDVSHLIQQDTAQRARLLDGIFVPKEKDQAIGRLAYAFTMVKKAEDIERKMRRAVRKKIIPKKKGLELVELAFTNKIIDVAEYETMKQAETVRLDAIQVDDFSPEEYFYKPSNNHGY